MGLRDSKNPLVQLVLVRLSEFFRRPEALFWTYGFPFIMLIALGMAFRNTAPAPMAVEVRGENVAVALSALQKLKPELEVKQFTDDAWQKRLQSGKVGAVLESNANGSYKIWSQDGRAESRTTRWILESALLRESNVANSTTIENEQLNLPGARYIDFLVPGMMAMNLMGGGLWGVGFAIVDMRVRKLLKRFLATPMSRWHFLASLLFVRIIFATVEITALILFAYFAFGVKCQGSLFDLAIVLFIGGATFTGIGLVIASRVQTIEAISGLMNLIMVPMWIVGGVFFSNERFPDVVQPILKALPFVALVNAARSIMLDGTSIVQLWSPILVMIVWGVLSFTIALKIFRWR